MNILHNRISYLKDQNNLKIYNKPFFECVVLSIKQIIKLIKTTRLDIRQHFNGMEGKNRGCGLKPF